MLKALQTLDAAPEKLRPYLSETEWGIWLDHPMAFTPLGNRSDYDVILDQLTAMERHAENLFEEKDWFGYINIHAKAHRVKALLKLIDHHHGASRLWPLIGRTWASSEGHSNLVAAWSEVWSHAYKHDGSLRKGHRKVMGAKDRKAYDLLPDSVIIYRGVSTADYLESFSWTLDREQAVWFSKRYSKTGVIGRTTIEKKHILALFNHADEQEIVVNPVELGAIDVEQS